MTVQASAIDTGAANHDIVYNRKNTFASYPSAVLILDLTIVEYGGLVQLDTPAMYGSSKRYLIWMEIFPARFPNYILRRVP